MRNSQMRTRFLTKLTNGEVEEYLNRNDIIYVPVGVTETHGALPLDSETVLSEAFALKMAEATDGLVLHNLPYFFAGATPVGRGTVQMSIRDGTAYLDKIAQSLLNQGFRRQVYVTLHGPAYLTVSPMVRDFFDKTKAPVLYMDMMVAIESLKNLSFNVLDKFNDMAIGAYAVLDRLEDVPLHVPESDSVSYDVEKVVAANKNNPASPLGKFAFQSGAIGYYFDQASDHLYTPLLKTAEDREHYAKSGIEAIHNIIEALDMPSVVKSIREVDEYTKDNSLDKYGEWLP
ncbi:creatinine amidohydrolase [Virgibacillus halotolerans]|uniref:creatininase family protein n=1 Tax=Virgibacillus halotolerans TaxID=1071053 RepID=UPI0019612B19|nr:creatininase family protein [Virgibacillus halotolerans]MBM7599237.1 creatinine amidohydrolase [Virgibacillus halotolerans]